MNSVPITLQVQKALRLHIGIFGCRNAGKSSLINRLTNQELSIVSDVPGTTTDPVEKACELHPIGPVVLIDTAGIDDTGALGAERVRKSLGVLSWMDLALLVIDAATGITAADQKLLKDIRELGTPAVVVSIRRTASLKVPRREWRQTSRPRKRSRRLPVRRSSEPELRQSARRS